MKNITLNFENCKYISEIHKVLKTGFDLPDYYGENWDALWDCLDGLFYDEGKVVVEIHNLNSLKDELQHAIKPMLEVFKDVHINTPNVEFRLVS